MPFDVIIDSSAQYNCIKLIDTCTKTEADIFAFGALLNAFTIESNGKKINIVDGYSSIADAAENITQWMKSGRLSPFVCRMQNGKYVWNKQEYRIEKNYLNEHAIHGILFDAVYAIKSTEINEMYANVKLYHHYKGADLGYPFHYISEIEWKLEANNKLTFTSTITNLEDYSIPYSEGWHPYFKLGESINDCTLIISSNEVLEMDKNMIPTGMRRSLLPHSQHSGYTKFSLYSLILDTCFAISNTGLVCSFKNDILQLDIYNNLNFPFLQVFTPDHKISIAIESLSAAPDSFNNGIGLKLLEKKEAEIFSASYQIKLL